MRFRILLMGIAVMNFAMAARAQWAIQTLDSSGADVGWYTSIKIVSGNPAIAYYRPAIDILYIRANDATGTTWSAPITINTAGNHGAGASLEIVNGNPAISCFGGFFGGVSFFRANNSTGGSWPGSPVTAAGGNTVIWTSLELVGSNPGIAFFDNTGEDLRFVRANNADGTTWGAIIPVDSSSSSVGKYCSLAMVAGNPAIAYIDDANGNLKYVRATNSTGGTWGMPVTLDAAGTGCLLLSVTGNPAIAYYSSGGVRFLRAVDATGSSWGSPATVSVSGGGEMLSMAIISGNPAVSFRGGSNLSYNRAVDAQGMNWPAAQTVEIGNPTGDFSSLVDINGGPAISYYDPLAGSLKYAYLAPPNAADGWPEYE